MKLKALLSSLLIVALLCPAALTEEALNEPLPVLEEVAVTDSSEEAAEPDGETMSSGSIDAVAQDAAPDVEDEGESEQPEQPQDSVPTDSEEEVLTVETVDEDVPEEDFEEDYACFEAEVADDVDFVSDEAADGVTTSGDVSIDSTNFPDSVFREKVLSVYDMDKNGLLSTSERSAWEGIGFYDEKVKDLTGIELFPNLKELSFHKTEITSLDLSGCTNLSFLNCYGNKLTSLDVSPCANLKMLWCWDNQLTSLNISGCNNLTDLSCYVNQLISLDVSDCTNLQKISCGNNQLTSLDVSGCTNLEFLECTDNQLTSLDIGGCTNLDTLYCSDNQLISLNISNLTVLTDLDCSGNKLRTLDVSNCPNLWRLSYSDNQISSLDISRLHELVALYCDGNQITSLDLSNCTSLQNLGCSNNNLKILDISKLNELANLHCEKNQITTLDISNCPKIIRAVNSEYYHPEDDPSTVVYVYSNDVYDELSCDLKVQIINTNTSAPDTSTDTGNTTGSSTDSPASAPAPAPAPATPTIPAVKKAGKTTISAAPGSVYQLDLGGTTGKAFKSSKKKVAVVNGAGQVTIRGAGKTKITFKVGKKKRTVTLTVKDPTIPTSVSLNPVNTAVKVGDAVTLTPVISPETNSTFKWKSSNKKVASVSNGVVTFKKAGKVTITCTAVRGKKKAKVTFRVSK